MKATALVVSTLAVAIIGSGTVAAEILIGVPAPFSGPQAWSGEETERGAAMAVAELNAAGGLLGQEVRIITVDDYCDSEQAVAAAHKLVADGVAMILGHACSGAAIPASRVYHDAGMLMIATIATNPALTEQGFANVFRFCGRDDDQGTMAAAYLADQWKGRSIAILHDGEVYGRGLAEETKRTLNARGVTEVLFGAIDPDAVDYTDVVDLLQAAGSDVLYYAGYPQSVALLIRQLRERGDDLQLVGGDALNPNFAMVAEGSADGALFTAYLNGRNVAGAGEILAEFRRSGTEPDSPAFLAYGAMQAWAQAVEQAQSLDFDAVSATLRAGEFDTIFGRVGFDDKGDVTGYEPFVWYRWQDGKIVPANLTE
jgi:branched-chain amino acid transport system substrate-binding protein